MSRGEIEDKNCSSAADRETVVLTRMERKVRAQLKPTPRSPEPPKDENRGGADTNSAEMDWRSSTTQEGKQDRLTGHPHRSTNTGLGSSDQSLDVVLPWPAPWPRKRACAGSFSKS